MTHVHVHMCIMCMYCMYMYTGHKDMYTHCRLNQIKYSVHMINEADQVGHRPLSLLTHTHTSIYVYDTHTHITTAIVKARYIDR